MKMPWTKSIDALRLKMQKTFDRISEVIISGDKQTYEKYIMQLNIFKKSEQIKYNRLNARLVELETCFKVELEHHKKSIEMKELAAATDAERGRL